LPLAILFGGPAALGVLEIAGLHDPGGQVFLLWGTVWLLLFVAAMVFSFGGRR
jgi:hypothetical protein